MRRRGESASIGPFATGYIDAPAGWAVAPPAAPRKENDVKDMRMNRREMLKGLSAMAALTAVPVPDL